MPSLVLRWSFENDKCEKTNTVTFGLPAFRAADGSVTCPGADLCAIPCYARQARYRLPNSIRTRETNLAIVRASLPLFERLAIGDLERVKNTSIRVHDSGDFFSQDYLDAWFRIMQRFPEKGFYCYSKSLHLDWSAKPPHFNMVQSFGGKFDRLIDLNKPHARIFPSHAERRRAGYVDGSKSDRPAQNGTIKIGLVYHGSTTITPRLIQIIRRTNEARA